MSEAIDRARIRENSIWSPFLHSYPFGIDQMIDRLTIFGLYSGSYINGHAYLNEIESSELFNIINDYNTKIAELTTQKQLLVAEIVSKRYLAGIDKIIHDQKMVTKSAKISAEDAEWTTKIAALAADQAALTTLVTRVASETLKANARISELTAYISTEGVNLSLVDLDIVEKGIMSAKKDIEKLDVSNAILRIQIETVNTASQLIDVDLQIARTKSDMAYIDANIAKIGLLDNDLEIAKVQTKIAEGETAIYSVRKDLALDKKMAIEDEIAYYDGTLMDREDDIYADKKALIDFKYGVKDDELRRSGELKDAERNNRVILSTLDVVFANNEQDTQKIIDDNKVDAMKAEEEDETRKVDAAIDAANIAAKANITSVLTHRIRKVS